MTVIVRTEAELRQWREGLLARLPDGMTEETLFERGRDWDLEPDLRSIYDTLVSIYYLLGEPEPRPVPDGHRTVTTTESSSACQEWPIPGPQTA